MNNVLYLLWGPTTTGKTAYSVSLAKKYNVPVMAIDRFQGYSEIMTGSGSPTADELQGTKRISLKPLKNLSEGIITSGEAQVLLREYIVYYQTAFSGILLEGGSVSLLKEIVGNDFWSEFSWVIKIFNTPPKDIFIERARKRVSEMFYPCNGRYSIIEEINIYFMKNQNTFPLNEIDGYREIINYCTIKGINFSDILDLTGKEKIELIDLISEEYYRHALWQEKEFPGLPNSWKYTYA